MSRVLCILVLSTLGFGPIALAQGPGGGGTAVRKDNEVFNVIPGQTTILSIKPEGSSVKKGEPVCELDPFALKTKLDAQEVATTQAEAAYRNAKGSREVAELAITEYVDGTFKQELEGIKSRITLAEAEVRRFEIQREKVKRLIEKGVLPKYRLNDPEVGLQRAKLALEKAQGQKSILEKFTLDKQIKTLQGRVEKARSDELAAQLTHERELSIRQKVLTQIEKCKVTAPADGHLRYSAPIEPGVDVAEGQLLFRVVPESGPKTAVK